MKANVLVIEPDVSGHHPNYMGLVASAFSEAGHAVTVAVDRSSAAIEEELGGKPWQVIDFRVPSKRGVITRDLDLVRDQIHYWYRCRQLIRHVRASGWHGTVFFPYLDRIIHALGLLGVPDSALEVSGILMRPQFIARRSSSSLKRRIRQHGLSAIFRRAVETRTVHRLFVIDPQTEADIAEVSADTARRVTRLVDPADCFRSRSRSEARRRLDLPAEGHIILAYGEISARKGVASLLRALAARPNFARALVAGRSGADLGDSLMVAVDNDADLLERLMIRIDRRISDEEERLLFEAVDSVWVAYFDHPGMSGVLVQAGQMGLPVFGCLDGVIGMYCREHGVGLALNPRAVDEVVDALDEIRADPESFSACGQRGFEVFRHFTRAAFKQRLTAN